MKVRSDLEKGIVTIELTAKEAMRLAAIKQRLLMEGRSYCSATEKDRA